MIVLVDMGDLFYKTLYNQKFLKKVSKFRSFKIGPLVLLERVLGLLKWVGGGGHLVLCRESYSWRKRMFKRYKRSRSSVHMALREKVMEDLKKLGFDKERMEKEFDNIWSEAEDIFKERLVLVAKCSGYEGDDLIALFTQYLDNDFIIFGVDTDLWQLVNKRVRILRMVPRKRAHIVDLYNIKYFLNGFYFKGYPILDLSPGHLVWLKLAFGDKADEVPPLIIGASTMFWYNFFKKNLNDLVVFNTRPDLFLDLVKKHIVESGVDYEIPSLEDVKQRYNLLSLHKDVLRVNNPEGFEEFKRLLEEFKKYPKTNLALLSEKIKELRYEVSNLWKK